MSSTIFNDIFGSVREFVCLLWPYHNITRINSMLSRRAAIFNASTHATSSWSLRAQIQPMIFPPFVVSRAAILNASSLSTWIFTPPVKQQWTPLLSPYLTLRRKRDSNSERLRGEGTSFSNAEKPYMRLSLLFHWSVFHIASAVHSQLCSVFWYVCGFVEDKLSDFFQSAN